MTPIGLYAPESNRPGRGHPTKDGTDPMQTVTPLLLGQSPGTETVLTHWTIPSPGTGLWAACPCLARIAVIFNRARGWYEQTMNNLSAR